MNSLHTVPREDGYNGNPRRRAKQQRFCVKCGRPVCSYKNPRAKKVHCYACEDKLPWNRERLIGRMRRED